MCLIPLSLYCSHHLHAHPHKSECLKEAFTDVDVSSEVMEFCISHKEPQLRISTYGQAGSTHVSRKYAQTHKQEVLL